jgi:hypothetical protein
LLLETSCDLLKHKLQIRRGGHFYLLRLQGDGSTNDQEVQPKGNGDHSYDLPDKFAGFAECWQGGTNGEVL